MNARLDAQILAIDGLEIRDAFDISGGCVSGDQLAALMNPVCGQAISRVARLLVERRLVRIDAGCQTLIPLFQLDERFNVRPVVHSVLAELSGLLDDQEIAEWFATPNCWISHKIPARIVGREDGEILEAARADRFLIRGL